MHCNLIVILAAIPLLDELVKEALVSLSLSVGLIAGIDLGNQGIALGRGLILGLKEREHDVGHQELAGDLPAEADDVGVELATGVQGARHVADQGATGAENLVHELVIPMLAPHRATPKSALPLATASPTALP